MTNKNIANINSWNNYANNVNSISFFAHANNASFEQVADKCDYNDETKGFVLRKRVT